MYLSQLLKTGVHLSAPIEGQYGLTTTIILVFLWCYTELHCAKDWEGKLHFRCYFEHMQTWRCDMWFLIWLVPAQLACNNKKKSISLRFIMHFLSLLDCKLRHRCEHSSCFCLKKRKWKTYKSLYGAKESTKFMSLMGTANCPSDLLLLISLNKTLSWRR